MLSELSKERIKWKMKKVERWREKKVRDNKVGGKNMLTFTKNENDSITVKHIKMTKWLY